MKHLLRTAMAGLFLATLNAQLSIAPAQGAAFTNLAPRQQFSAMPCALPEIVLFTNASAFIPGFGLTNFPDSTTFGLQEVVNLFPWQSNSYSATQPMAGGVKIRLAPGDYAFSSEINLNNNNLTIEGAGPFQTVLKWTGSTNHSHLIYEPQTVTNGQYLALRDLSIVVPVNFAAVILDLTNAMTDIENIGVIGPNRQNLGTYTFWPGWVTPNTNSPSLVALKLAVGASAGNWHYVRNSFFVGNAVAIYIPDSNWNLIDGCMFIASSQLESASLAKHLRSFTNTYAMGNPLHCGAAIISQNAYGMTRVANGQFSDCNAGVANFGVGEVIVSDNKREDLGAAFYEDDGTHAIVFEEPVPDLADPDASEFFLEQVDSNYNILHPGSPASHAAYSGLHYVSIYNDGRLPVKILFASVAIVALVAFLMLNQKLKARSQEFEVRSKQSETENVELKLRLEKLEQIINEKNRGGK
jgi:hypothetical protein